MRTNGEHQSRRAGGLNQIERTISVVHGDKAPFQGDLLINQIVTSSQVETNIALFAREFINKQD